MSTSTLNTVSHALVTAKRNVEVDPLILKGGGGITGGWRVEG